MNKSYNFGNNSSGFKKVDSFGNAFNNFFFIIINNIFFFNSVQFKFIKSELFDCFFDIILNILSDSIEQKNIDLTKNSSGIYLLNLTINGKSYNKKIIKN